MLYEEIAPRVRDVRAATDQLAAHGQADATLLAPLLAAVHALEQSVLAADPAPPTPPAAASCVVRDGGTFTIDQFHQILAEVPTGICIFEGPEYRYTFTNPSYEQLVARTDMVGKPLHVVFPELEGQGFYEILDRVYTTGEPFDTPQILAWLDRNGDGVVEDLYATLSYRPLRDQHGTIIGVIAYVVDISDRRALEQEREHVLRLTQEAHHVAEAERQRLLRVLQQAPAAICTLEGPEHVYTFTNAAYEQFVGRTDLIGLPIRIAVPEVDGQGFFEILDTVYTTGISVEGKDAPVQLDRYGTGMLETICMTYSFAPLLDDYDHVTGVFVQVVEVTELVTARQAAEAAVVLRDQFLSVAAHELRTPLTTILGSIDLLHHRLRRAGLLDPRTAGTFAIMQAQGQRLTRLISVLLDMARMNLGRLTLDQAPVDLGALVTQVVEEVRLMQQIGMIAVDVPSETWPIQGDRLRLEQVLVNLVQNAVKYSPNGGTITVTLGYAETYAWVRVEDQGIGIPAADIPHLFERFYRVEDHKNRVLSGMGIGLSVVHEIVTLHGGTITVESAEGVGSTFTVFLPRDRAGRE